MSTSNPAESDVGLPGWLAMRRPGRSVLSGVALILATPGMLAADRPPSAPPPATPVLHRSDAVPGGEIRPLGPQRYSIGEPTDEEQLYLELINRARADPGAEGVRLAASNDPDVLIAYDWFGVGLNALTSELNALSPTPPLSFHPLLMDAARLHTGDMFTNVFQGHTNSWDGGLVGERLSALGYGFSWAGENVYSFAEGVEHGHAGFEVDWGPGLDGMQGPPRGHRENIHNANFREIGIGVINGVNSRPGAPDPVGPQLVTQAFGSRPGMGPLVTGVAYYDLNGNSFYDQGEGLGGVTVDVVESSWQAVTAGSGGYSVPVPGDGIYSVHFQAPGRPTEIRTVTVSGGANLKVDFRPAYSAPQVSGPVLIAVGADSAYTVSEVALATNYAWNAAAILPWSGVEGAENGTNNFRVTASPGYSVISTQTKASGSAAFHLVMPPPEPQTQSLELLREVRLGSNAALSFASRLGVAGDAQTARVETSLDGGATWSAVWNRVGTGDSGQASFETVVVPLGAHAGRLLQVRFVYAIGVGGFYDSTAEGVGWYVDDIRFTDAVELVGAIRQVIGSPAFTFHPPAPGQYSLWAEAQVSGHWLPAGSELVVEASASLPVVNVVEWGPAAGGGWQLDCQVQNGTPASVELQWRAGLDQAWQTDLTQTPALIAPARYRFSIPAGGEPERYFRVKTQF